MSHARSLFSRVLSPSLRRFKQVSVTPELDSFPFPHTPFIGTLQLVSIFSSLFFRSVNISVPFCACRELVFILYPPFFGVSSLFLEPQFISGELTSFYSDVRSLFLFSILTLLMDV